MSTTESTTAAEQVISMTRSDLESLIRSVVREELKRALRPVNLLDDWSHEGPDDPEGDEILAREALAQLEEIKKNLSQLKSWEEFEAELATAEAAGELPD
jgi:hypothetical protein